MQLYIYLLIRTRNPDNRTFGPRASVLVLRSSCFGPRASVLVLRSSRILPYIYGGARYSEMSGALRCYLIGVSLHLVIFKKRSMRLCSKRFYKLSTRIFMGFYFQGCRERVPSLHPIIFEKGCMKPYIKRFSKLSTRIFMGFYFEVCREPLLYLHFTILEKESLTLCSKRFCNLSTNIFMGFILQSCRERV